MSDPRHHVHTQSNGVRIKVPTQPEYEEPPGNEPPPLPRRPPPLPGRPAPSASRASASGPSLQLPEISLRGWGPAAVLGGLVTLLCAFVYNAVVLATYIDFRILAILSGSMIGYAVRAGNPPGKSWMHRGFAMLLTYACVASTHTWWFYDAIVHPERYELAFEDVDPWGYEAYEPEPEPVAKPEGPIRLQSLDAPSGPSVPSFGVEVGAAFTAVGMSLFLPLVLVGSADLFGLVFLGLALLQAWKLASPGWQ